MRDTSWAGDVARLERALERVADQRSSHLRDAEDIRQAMTVYFDVIGKLGALDLLGAPDAIPRLSQLRVRSTLRFFENAFFVGNRTGE